MARELSEEIARVHGPIEAEVVRGLLESYGIPVRLASAVPHSLLPFNIDGLGDVRVYVQTADVTAAGDLLARHRQAGFVAVAGGRSAEVAEAGTDRRRSGPAGPGPVAVPEVD